MTRRFLTVILLAAGGCAPLAITGKPSNRLPISRLAPDAIVLDVAFVRLPAANEAAYEAIWEAADEQRLKPELRRDLASNGLRVGVFGQQLPTALRELVDAPQDTLVEQSQEFDASAIRLSGGRQHLQLRSGRGAKVVASKTFPELPMLLCEEGRIRGHQLSQAQCLLAVKAYPQGDSRVKLELLPEIEHGEMKSQWVGSEGSFMQRAGRERLALDRLRLQTLLSPGQWLVLSTTPEIKGLGESFFSESAGGTVDRRVLVMRLSQTQFDDLFAPEQTSAPLATPGE